MSKVSEVRTVPRRLLFITGTRADFGKLKGLMLAAQESPDLDAIVVVTGMHLLHRYGYTAHEVVKAGLRDLRMIPNQLEGEPMAQVLANTVQIVGRLIHEDPPAAIVVHGDRVEALAGAIAGSLSNVRVIHIEGGERSGTIDDVLRHSASKHAHVHLVSNEASAGRLLQLGEDAARVFIVGSPEVDVLRSSTLPSIDEVRKRYDIGFSDFGILALHPVTTEPENQALLGRSVTQAASASGRNWVVIDPNNDEGCHVIRAELASLVGPRYVRLPSMRFEAFVTLMAHARVLVGNSSAGVREAPVLALPSVNVGTRQRNRAVARSVTNVPEDTTQILAAIDASWHAPRREASLDFGLPGATCRILDLLQSDAIWRLPLAKEFHDLPFSLAPGDVTDCLPRRTQ